MSHPNKKSKAIKEYFDFLCRIIKAFPPFYKEIYSNSPALRYAYRYFLSIPFFALVYWLFPSLLSEPGDYLDSLYFSVVTITTLGFGDVTPETGIGKLIVMTQVVLGVAFWGLFLNALSREYSDFRSDMEKSAQEYIYNRKEKARLRGYWNLMNPDLNYYIAAISMLTGTTNDNKLLIDFPFKSLGQFSDSIALTTHNMNVTKIEYYYEKLKIISSHITASIREIDLHVLDPKLEQDCINFVKATHELDHSGFLIQLAKEGRDQGALKNFIANYNGPIEYKEGSILNPFISLHNQLKYQIFLISEIINKIDVIIPQHNKEAKKML